MAGLISIYCDESCHLEHELSNVMAIGAIWCEHSRTKEVTSRIIDIKKRYNLNHEDEVKWNKISSNHYQIYLDLIDYFFDEGSLRFRGVIIPDKSILDHNKYGQSHDEWYYKMFFRLINPIIDPNQEYQISLDYKDILGGQRVRKLQEVLCNSLYDFNHSIIKSIILVKSHHVELIQLVDLIVGALSYNARNLDTNAGKIKIINRIKERSKYNLTKSTLLKEDKFNFLIWDSKMRDDYV